MQKTNSWRSLFSRPENELMVGWQFLLAGMLVHLVFLLGGDVSVLKFVAFIPYEFVLGIIALVLRNLFRCHFVLSWAYVHVILFMLVLVYFYLTMAG